MRGVNHMVQTGVILAAGKGLRRWPITRAIDKAMLPIGNRPVIDYVIEQCAAAGIRRIVITVNSAANLIRRYYSDSINIATVYPWLGVTGAMRIEYVVQPDDSYGTAYALACTEQLVPDDRFVVMPADGFVYNPHRSELLHILKNMSSADEASGAIGGLEMNGDTAGRYSIIIKGENGRLVDLVEKPGNLKNNAKYAVNVSYYVLPHKIFDSLRVLEPKNGEYYLTDAVVHLSAKMVIPVIPIAGEYLDSGQLDAWLYANNLMVTKQNTHLI